MPLTVLLDLDGTLVDTAPDLAGALSRVIGLAPFTESEVAGMIGDGTEKLVQRACAARNQPYDPELHDAFTEEYGAHIAEGSAPYAGVLPTLQRMTALGWFMAVCTNKPEAMARRLLAALGFAGLFNAIGGGDSYDVRKPDPRHLLATLQAGDGTLEQAVMVGDHANDVTAARLAGIPCLFAAWGYGTMDMARGSAGTAMRFEDIPRMAARLILRRTR